MACVGGHLERLGERLLCPIHVSKRAGGQPEVVQAAGGRGRVVELAPHEQALLVERNGACVLLPLVG